jgi:hypothetical protein
MLLAIASFSAGATLAWHHPLWPIAVLAGLGVWTLLVTWRPGIWLVTVPVCVTFMNFSPWSGWLIFDEFDILLLGALSGGYARIFLSPPPQPRGKIPAILLGLATLLGGAGLLCLYRGFSDAGGVAFDWYAGYTDALNSLRVFKSLGFALLFIPLLQRELRHSAALATQRLATGMVGGITVVTLAVVWERAAFPGLLDFSTNYRTVALFWEMHTGGAALDAYLALSAPFVVYALVSARRPMSWAGAAILALLVGYAVLTTFARGVYLAVAGSLVLLAVPVWQRSQSESWRATSGLLLALALTAEAVAVIGGGSFMMERLASTDRDLSTRTEHWRQGLALLDGPADWVLGKGLGRFPKNYADQAPQGEFSGEVKWHTEQTPTAHANSFVTVLGPKTQKSLGGQYALTQRLSKLSPGPHYVRLDIRAEHEIDLHLKLCDRHLLYDAACQRALIRVPPGKTPWQTLVVPLKGPALRGGPWYAPRLNVFSLSVISTASAGDFDNVRLIGANRQEMLINGTFNKQLAHWFPSAQSYFLPWHIDNLFLELLIEQGATGLLIFSALLGYAMWRLITSPSRKEALSPYLAASLCAALCVGLVSSFMDVPRVTFLLYFLALFSIQLTLYSEHEKNQIGQSRSAQTPFSARKCGVHT